MKSLFHILITTDFPPTKGGIQRLLFNVYSRWHKNNLTVIAPYVRGAEEWDKTSGMKVLRAGSLFHVLPHSTYLPFFLLTAFLWLCLLILKKRLKGYKVFVHCGHILTGVLVYPLSFTGVRFLVWTHANEVMVEKRKKLYSRVLERASGIITVSEFTARHLISSLRVEREKVKKIRPPVVLPEKVPEEKVERVKDKFRLRGKRVLLTVARLTPLQKYKGIDMSLRALVKVKERFSEVVYVIVGEGELQEEYEKLAEELGVKESVIFTGGISDEELWALYELCDVFVMPSRVEKTRKGVLGEGFGLVFLEANWFGKPVIGGEGGCRDAIIDNKTGFTVNPVEPREIASKLILLLENPELAKRMGEEGKRWAKSVKPEDVRDILLSFCE